MNRRQFLHRLTFSAVAASIGPRRLFAQTTGPTTAPGAAADEVVWHDVRDWGAEGRGFNDTASYFDRLPARARGVVRDDVWNLSHHTSGMSARFEAQTPAVYVRYALNKSELAMPHMPATGVSGLDLYAGRDNRWRWAATFFPKSQTNAGPITRDNLSDVRRTFQLNLPLYNGIKSLEVGLPREADKSFAPIAPRMVKPLLFYGTSITQGGCASRPGMSFVNILGRRLDRPVLNFGFSGNGRMEIEVAKFLAELDPAVFVIDCVANTTARQIAERTGPLVRLLRAAHASTPILLLEERARPDAAMSPRLAQEQAAKRAALRKAYEDLAWSGVAHLHYRAGDDLLGRDGEATVDGSHPNDLGMMRYADALEHDLRELIGTES